ncbi:MAG: CYTH domain-containing protein [Leptolyngbyaceae cyanobacterium SL_7_1]|nr:CYTH domain-containing protein [Leptolyngbyaceae cyanobacterium SL_7_1]
MPTEIERKFLVNGDAWRSLGSGVVYRQGYLASDSRRSVRVRVAGDRGFLTIKGATVGIARAEYEYAIPLSDAEELLETLCDRPLIEKTRYSLTVEGLVWEVDEFMGDNQGLIVAEVELESADQRMPLPDWIGQEVSHDPRYFNSNLAKHPFRQW